MLLPHNNDVTEPRALNTFLSGLAELEVDRGFIINKKVPLDLIEKGYWNSENTFECESNREESASDREEEGEQITSVNGSEAEHTQERNNDTENEQKVVALKRPQLKTT